MTTQRTLKSKICLVGEKAVGKTSLIRRYVLNMFDEQYLTTIGTRVSKKEVRVLLPEQDLPQIAKAYGSEYIMTSAKTGEKVEDAFLRLGSLVAEHQLQLV